MELTIIQQVCIWAIPVLFAITVHEVAHGWVARRCGDPTAFLMGRLTLNPLKHIDPVGTILVPGLLLAVGGFIFGWAKPVPVNTRHFRRIRRDIALVAIAGPMANLVMALIWATIGAFAQQLIVSGHALGIPMGLMGDAGIRINLILLLLNLLPIPPLDGSRVVSSFLPPHASMWYNRLEPWGFFILLFLLATGLLSQILGPAFIASYIWFLKTFHLVPML